MHNSLTRSALLYELYQTGRPSTGLYAFIATTIGFAGLQIAWSTVLVSAVTFACLTMSIMTFNDIADRKRDALPDKARDFALRHLVAMRTFWLLGATVVGVLLVYLHTLQPSAAYFCAAVWALGLGYSFTPKLFLFQKLLVALCSASPILCGGYAAGVWQVDHVASFRLMLLVIIFNEFLKDVPDRYGDVGHKNTVPVLLDSHRRPYRVRRSAVFTAPLIVFVSLAGWSHPNALLGYMVAAFGTVLIRQHVLLVIHPVFVSRVLSTNRSLIYAIGGTLAVSAVL